MNNSNGKQIFLDHVICMNEHDHCGDDESVVVDFVIAAINTENASLFN